MNAPDTSHALAPDLALLVPAEFAIRSAAQGLTAVDAATGVVLTVLLKRSASGGPDRERLHESAITLLRKKHAGAERLGEPAPIVVSGNRGCCELLRATGSNGAVHLVLTTLIVPDSANNAEQRNLIVVLEVPAQAFEQRPGYYQRFAQDRLRIGNAGAVKQTPPALEMAPLHGATNPDLPAAVTATPDPLMPRPATTAPGDSRKCSRRPEPDENELLASAALGQRTLAISILLTFVARGIGNVPEVPVFLAYAISTAVLLYAISGVLRICSGFRYSLNHKLVLMFCSSVPLVSLVCWVWLSVRTTRRLRAAGFQVGLFGARR